MFPPCDDCLSVHSDSEEDFQPLTPSGLDIPTNPVFTFLSPHLYLPKYPLAQRRLIIHPSHICNWLRTPELQPQTLLILYQLDYSSRFLSPKKIFQWLHKNCFHLTRFNLMSDPFSHAPITSNFILIAVLLNVNIVVSSKLTRHGRQEDPVSIIICITI